MIKSICFSGHRFDKIKSIISDKTSNEKIQQNFFEIIKSIIYIKINYYIDLGYQKFYIGMADGIDLWVAEQLLELKMTQYPNMEIVAVRPFHNHGNNFSLEDRLLYNNFLKIANEVVCLHYQNSKGAYFERNRYMVEHSDITLAFVGDYQSGTGYTINYAKSLNKSVEIINLLSLSEDLIKSISEHRYFYGMVDYI